MKKTLVAVLLVFVSIPALCQEDLQMFETDATVNVQQKRDRNPNIGADAKKVDKITITPVLPPVSVSMSDEKPSAQPFSNATLERSTEKAKPAKEKKVSENLSKPVDFSASMGKDIQIIVPQKTQVEIKPIPQEKEPVKPQNEEIVVKAITQTQKPVIKKEEPQKAQIKVPETPKVELFNIADIYLGMQPEDVIETAAESGFEVTNVAYGIPSFMITDYERMCRQSGLHQTRLIHECIRETAKDNDVYYVSQLVFERLDSKEKITVLFSSSLTDNKAFKIDYTAFGDNSLGTSYKDLLKKTHRRDIFWKYVYDKYGKPAGQKVFFWGSPKKVYLKAFLAGNSMDGRIILEDVQQTGVDYTQAEDQDKEKDVNNPFHF